MSKTRARQLEIVERRFRCAGVARSSDVAHTARSAPRQLASRADRPRTHRSADGSRNLQTALGRYPDGAIEAARLLPDTGAKLPAPGTPEQLISLAP